MDRNFRHIQMVRRLVSAGRYNEARVIMKETNHPQIPALERRVNRLTEANAPKEQPHQIVTKGSVTLGTIAGVVLVLMNLMTGTRYLPFLIICFVLGFGFGMILPEYERRRNITRDIYIKLFFKKLNSPKRD